MLHLAFLFMFAMIIYSRRRPWWQGALLLLLSVPLQWLNFTAGRARAGLDSTPSDPLGRLVVLVGMHLVVISVAWALCRWLKARNRIRIGD